MANKIKENWNAVDEKCPYCGNITKRTIGINKQNLKKLFFSKPTLQEIIIFIMLILCLTLAWSYTTETAQYKEMINNPGDFCIRYYNSILSDEFANSYSNTNNSNSQIKEFPLLK